jgi:hypothetical protein
MANKDISVRLKIIFEKVSDRKDVEKILWVTSIRSHAYKIITFFPTQKEFHFHIL